MTAHVHTSVSCLTVHLAKIPKRPPTLATAGSLGGLDVVQSDVPSVGGSPDALKDQVGGAGLGRDTDLTLDPLVALRLVAGPHRWAQVAASLNHMHGKRDGSMDGQMDGWMSGGQWMDRQADRRQIER